MARLPTKPRLTPYDRPRQAPAYVPSPVPTPRPPFRRLTAPDPMRVAAMAGADWRMQQQEEAAQRAEFSRRLAAEREPDPGEPGWLRNRPAPDDDEGAA